jgi:hypothetical protein
MRTAAILLAFTVGCSDKQDLQPFVAVAGAYSLLDVEPKPAPKPDVCENCGGTGVVGDGRVSVPCPVCRPSATKPPACEGGKCPTPVTRR